MSVTSAYAELSLRIRTVVPTRSALQTFVSSNKSDVFKCHSMYENMSVNIPYACSYSHGELQCIVDRLKRVNVDAYIAAKLGRVPHLAIATEQGTVDILNTSRRDDWDVGRSYPPIATGAFTYLSSPRRASARYRATP